MFQTKYWKSPSQKKNTNKQKTGVGNKIDPWCMVVVRMGSKKMIKKMGHCSSWEINKGEKGVKDYQSPHRDDQMAGATN